MKKIINAGIFAMFTLISAVVLAEIRTATLSVSGMT